MTRLTSTIGMALIGGSLALGAGAQDVDDIGPAVDTSAEMSEPAPDRQTEPRDDIEPAVTTGTPVRRSSAEAIDSLSLDTSQITGNQELPQVLYIVPWKSSDLGDLVGRPVNTLLDEVLAPADREVFIRQVGYYEDLHGDGGDDS